MNHEGPHGIEHLVTQTVQHADTDSAQHRDNGNRRFLRLSIHKDGSGSYGGRGLSGSMPTNGEAWLSVNRRGYEERAPARHRTLDFDHRCIT